MPPLGFDLLLAMLYLLIALLSVKIVHAQDTFTSTYVPVNAKIYAPILDKELHKDFDVFPFFPYFGGLIEQESCIALTWHSCWNPKTQLLTKREQGAGLGQLTRAFNSNGTVRFDSLEAIRAQHHRELKDLSWANILTRPDLQMRAMIIMSRDNYNRLSMVPDSYNRMAFSDSAYNEGLGGVYRDRRLCNLTKGCNPNIWFDNVSKVCMGREKPIYGNRTPCDINRTHVYNVLLLRMDKYRPLLGN